MSEPAKPEKPKLPPFSATSEDDKPSTPPAMTATHRAYTLIHLIVSSQGTYPHWLMLPAQRSNLAKQLGVTFRPHYNMADLGISLAKFVHHKKFISPQIYEHMMDYGSRMSAAFLSNSFVKSEGSAAVVLSKNGADVGAGKVRKYETALEGVITHQKLWGAVTASLGEITMFHAACVFLYHLRATVVKNLVKLAAPLWMVQLMTPCIEPLLSTPQVLARTIMPRVPISEASEYGSFDASGRYSFRDKEDAMRFSPPLSLSYDHIVYDLQFKSTKGGWHQMTATSPWKLPSTGHYKFATQDEFTTFYKWLLTAFTARTQIPKMEPYYPEAFWTIRKDSTPQSKVALMREVYKQMQSSKRILLVGSKGCGKSSLIEHLQGGKRPVVGGMFCVDSDDWGSVLTLCKEDEGNVKTADALYDIVKAFYLGKYLADDIKSEEPIHEVLPPPSERKELDRGLENSDAETEQEKEPSDDTTEEGIAMGDEDKDGDGNDDSHVDLSVEPLPKSENFDHELSILERIDKFAINISGAGEVPPSYFEQLVKDNKLATRPNQRFAMKFFLEDYKDTLNNEYYGYRQFTYACARVAVDLFNASKLVIFAHTASEAHLPVGYTTYYIAPLFPPGDAIKFRDRDTTVDLFLKKAYDDTLDHYTVSLADLACGLTASVATADRSFMINLYDGPGEKVDSEETQELLESRRKTKKPATKKN